MLGKWTETGVGEKVGSSGVYKKDSGIPAQQANSPKDGLRYNRGHRLKDKMPGDWGGTYDTQSGRIRYGGVPKGTNLKKIGGPSKRGISLRDTVQERHTGKRERGPRFHNKSNFVKKKRNPSPPGRACCA